MSSFGLKPAAELLFVEIADLLTRGFEGYFVPIHITESVSLTMLRHDSIGRTPRLGKPTRGNEIIHE